MIDFSTLQGLTIPEGVVTQIADSNGRVLWMLQSNKPVVLEVEKITSNTYAGETTYENEQFILLDIYPKTNGTVFVTYGGLTKTITDTSGAAEPNAQQVFFGTFNGVSDGVETPASGTLTIEGDCVSVGVGRYRVKSGKIVMDDVCPCVTDIKSLGEIEEVHDRAFYMCQSLQSVVFPNELKAIGAYAFSATWLTSLTLPKTLLSIGDDAFWSVGWDPRNLTAKLTDVIIPSTVTFLGENNFAGNVLIDNETVDVACYLKTLTVLATTPPTIEWTVEYKPFGNPTYQNTKIIVPKGCSNAYKSAIGWSEYADIIVEAS